MRKRRVPRNLAILHLQGFFSRRNVSLRSQRGSRRITFKTIDYNPDEAGCGLQNTCFAYRPHEEGIGESFFSGHVVCISESLGPVAIFSNILLTHFRCPLAPDWRSSRFHVRSRGIWSSNHAPIFAHWLRTRQILTWFTTRANKFGSAPKSL